MPRIEKTGNEKPGPFICVKMKWNVRFWMALAPYHPAFSNSKKGMKSSWFVGNRDKGSSLEQNLARKYGRLFSLYLHLAVDRVAVNNSTLQLQLHVKLHNASTGKVVTSHSKGVETTEGMHLRKCQNCRGKNEQTNQPQDECRVSFLGKKIRRPGSAWPVF